MTSRGVIVLVPLLFGGLVLAKNEYLRIWVKTNVIGVIVVTVLVVWTIVGGWVPRWVHGWFHAWDGCTWRFCPCSIIRAWESLISLSNTVESCLRGVVCRACCGASSDQSTRDRHIVLFLFVSKSKRKRDTISSEREINRV